MQVLENMSELLEYLGTQKYSPVTEKREKNDKCDAKKQTNKPKKPYAW